MPPEENQEEENQESLTEKQLSRVFEDAETEDNSAEESTEETEEPKANGKDDSAAQEESEDDGLEAFESKISSLEEKLNSLNEANIRLQTENKLLQERFSKEDQSEDEDTLDLSDLNQKLAKDPGKTIAELVKKIESRTEKRLLALAEKNQDSISESTRLAQAHAQDKAIVESRYKDFLQDEAFMELAGNVYAQMKEAAGGKYVPGSMSQAMAIAHSQLVLDGKIRPKTRLQEKVSKPARAIFGDPKDGESTELDTLTEGFSPSELRYVKSLASKLGIDPKKALKNYRAEKAKNPSFGGGQ